MEKGVTKTQRLQYAVARARRTVAAAERDVEHAQYYLKNSKAILADAEKALSAHLETA